MKKDEAMKVAADEMRDTARTMLAATLTRERLEEYDRLVAAAEALEAILETDESATCKDGLQVEGWEPEGMETRQTRTRVAPAGEPIHSDKEFTVEIDSDCSGGEFVTVTEGSGVNTITINPDEWPALREAIDKMIGECREGGA